MIVSGRKILVAAFVLISALLVVACIRVYQPRWAVARYKRQLLLAGEKLKIEELLPPFVFPESNGAPVFAQVMTKFGYGTNLLDKNTPMGMRIVAPGKAMIGWAQPDVRSEATNTWEEVEAALAQYRQALDLVKEAAQRPVFDFRLNYHQGPTLLLPHLSPLKRAVQMLAVAALCDLRHGYAGPASTNILVMLALVKATASEPLVISQMVRIRMAHILAEATWALLQFDNLTDEELAPIQREWSGLTFIQSAEVSLEMKRAMYQTTLQRMRNSSAEFRRVAWGGFGPVSYGSSLEQITRKLMDGTAARIAEARWRLASSSPDELRGLRVHQVLLDGCRDVRAGRAISAVLDVQQIRLRELGFQSWEYGPILMDMHPLDELFSYYAVSSSKLIEWVFTAELDREMTVTALALKRYQLAHGQYPAELSALVPEFLAAVPCDPADGKLLRFKKNPDGTFLLYSVGKDGIDNGGDPTLPPKSESDAWQLGRDAVWPSPATPEEVSAYLQRNATKNSGKAGRD
jgi:hypothetical protein